MFNRIVLAAVLVFVACGCGEVSDEISNRESALSPNACIVGIWTLRPSPSFNNATLKSSPPFDYTNGVSNANAYSSITPIGGGTYIYSRQGLGTISMTKATCSASMQVKTFTGTGFPIDTIGAYQGCQTYLANSTVLHCTVPGGAVTDYPVGSLGLYINNKNQYPVAQYIENFAYFEFQGVWKFGRVQGHF